MLVSVRTIQYRLEHFRRIFFGFPQVGHFVNVVSC